MTDYRLITDYWDGETLRRKGEVVAFEAGKQPKAAKLIEAPKATRKGE